MNRIKFLAIVILTIISAQQIFSQTATDNFNKLIGEGNLNEAAAFIPEASQENRKKYEFQMLCGDVLSELENYSEAIKYYEKARDIEGNEIDILQKIGKTQSLLSKHNEAIETLKLALDKKNKNITTQLELADAYIRAKQDGEAQKILTNAKKQEPSNPKVYITEGDLYFSKGIYELAKTSYVEALELDKNLLQAREKLAISYYWLANREYDKELKNELFAKCIDEWQKVTQDDPQNAKAFYEQGKIFFWSSLYKQAAKSFYSYVQLRPEGALGKWFLGQSLFELGECDSAAPFLEYSAKAIDTITTKAQTMLAECYYNKKKYDLAQENFAKIAQSIELPMNYQRMWATSKLYNGDTLGAVELYTVLVDKYPDDNCQVMDLVGRLMVGAKSYDKALYFLNKKLDTKVCRDSNDSKIYYFAGLASLFSYRADMANDSVLLSAINYFDLSISSDSSNISAMVYKADALISLKKIDEGIKTYQSAINFAKKDANNNQQFITQSYVKLCGYYLDAKKNKELLVTSKEWTETQTENPYGYLYFAIANQIDGKAEAACTNYKKVLKFDAENKTAKDQIKNLDCK